MTRRTKSLAAFLATAITVFAFLYSANYVFPHVLYWPAVIVALPAMPFIFLCSLIFYPLHIVYVHTFPALFWGLVSAGVVEFLNRRS